VIKTSPTRVKKYLDGELLEGGGSSFQDFYCFGEIRVVDGVIFVEFKKIFCKNSEVSEVRKGGKIDYVNVYCFEDFSTILHQTIRQLTWCPSTLKT